jgi:DNA-binding transcriptional MerR regulator
MEAAAMSQGLYVSEVARRAGVNLQTVLYYEREGLIPRASRTQSRYRVFEPDAVPAIRFIKRAQELGFTLDEIGRLLKLRGMSEESCEDVLEIARDKVHVINAKIADLQAMRDALRALMKSCSRKRPLARCPIIESLERNNSHAVTGSALSGRGKRTRRCRQ